MLICATLKQASKQASKHSYGYVVLSCPENFNTAIRRFSALRAGERLFAPKNKQRGNESMKKKILSLALALVMCLGLTVPAFAAESDWKLEVPGKSNAEVFTSGKTFILRDCGRIDYDMITHEEVFLKADDLQWTAKNMCVLEKGDTAVFTYTYKPQESTGQGAFSGGAISSIPFQMIAWSDPDGDGVYDARLIRERDMDNYDYEEDGYCDLLPKDRYEVLPAGTDVKNNPDAAWFYQSSWSERVSFDEEQNYEEARLSADRLLELFGPNTLVGIYEGGIYTSDPAEMDWFILVEGNVQPTVPTVGGFTDVKTGDYFADPVLWAVEKKITAGTSATTFSPNATCSQGQILTFLWRAKGEPNPTGTVSGTQYYATAAQWAKEQGLTDNFSAETDCTRAMVVTYLWKLAGSPKAGASNFSDVAANADYAQAVAWAVEQGITSGIGSGQFGPSATCTRGQIVSFLYRAFAK